MSLKLQKIGHPIMAFKVLFAGALSRTNFFNIWLQLEYKFAKKLGTLPFSTFYTKKQFEKPKTRIFVLRILWKIFRIFFSRDKFFFNIRWTYENIIWCPIILVKKSNGFIKKYAKQMLGQTVSKTSAWPSPPRKKWVLGCWSHQSMRQQQTLSGA